MGEAVIWFRVGCIIIIIKLTTTDALLPRQDFDAFRFRKTSHLVSAYV